VDIGTLLDTTTPVKFDFMDHEIVAHLFTAGWARLTQEQRDLIAATEEKIKAIEGEVETPEGDLTAEGFNRVVARARCQLPMMLSAWDFDGSPMERGGEPWPPTSENMANTPDALLVAAYCSTYQVWTEGPTNGAEPQTGLQPEATPEENQTESSTP
jgi:hypothetical protein